MPIKAKPVNPARAALVARGHLVSSSRAARLDNTALAGKNYYYYETVKRRAHTDLDDVQSASSTSSSASVSRNSSPARGAAGAVQPLSSDEVERRAAQERTRHLLYPKEEQTQRPVSTSDTIGKTRLATYMSAVRDRQTRANTVSATAMTTVPGGDATMSKTSAQVTTPPPLHDLSRMHESEAVEAATPSPRLMASCAAQLSETQAAVPVPEPEDAQEAGKEAFTRLMNLFARDIAAERAAVANPPPATPPPPASSPSPVIDVEVAEPRVRDGTGFNRSSTRTFAQLQQDALQELYDRWCAEASTTASVATPFVATEHMSEAFSLAAACVQAAKARPITRHVDAVELTPSELDMAPPLTLPDVAAAETRRRNAALVGDAAVTDAAQLAHAAQARLDRFFGAVRCVERVVRERCFVRSVGQFLYERHRVFLRPPSASAATDAAEQTALQAYSHEQFATYVDFSTQISEVLRRTLVAQVPGFDEEEFAAALYATPVTYCDDDATAWQGTLSTADHDVIHASQEEALRGPMNVLSYPAWRILLAMSDFAAFCDWVGDYICEEYHVHTDGDGAVHDAVATVAGAGARGVRALMRSTYHLRHHMAQTSDDVAATPPSQSVAPASSSDTHSAAPCAGVNDVPDALSPALTSATSDTVHETTATNAAPLSASLRAWMHAMSDVHLAPPSDVASLPATPLTHALTTEQRHSSASTAMPTALGRGVFPVAPLVSPTGSASQVLLFARPPHQKRLAARAGRNLPPLPRTSPGRAPDLVRTNGMTASQRTSLCSSEAPCGTGRDAAPRKPLSGESGATRGMQSRSHGLRRTR